MALSVVYSACSEVPEGVIGDANASGGTSGVSGASGTAGASGSATGGTGTGATGNGGASMGATGGSGVGGTGGTGTGGVGALGGGGATGGTGGSTTGGTGGDLGGGGASGTGPQLDDATCTAFPQQNERAKFITENHPDAVSHLPSQLSDKIRMLSGTTTSACNWQCFDAFGVPSSNIPEFRMRDGPRGVRGNAAPYDNGTKTTAFAVAEARAASFDLELEYKIGQAMAAELRALRRDILLAPTINTLRHPRWARAQETYGEDPVLVGEMGAAFTKGHQDGPAPGLGMPACPKHYVGNDTDENRGGGNETRIVDVRYDSAQTLHENYLRPFEITVEKADPACIMAAYNKVDGELSSQNKHILVDILRTAWKWKGFTVSDWWATGSGAASPSEGPTILGNGLDCEMPTNEAFAGLGSAQSAQVNIAAKRILDARASFGQLTAAYISAHDQNPDTSVVAANADLARESSEKGAILLQNDGILPLGKQVGTLGTPTLTSIIVLGPDANVPVANTDSGAHGLGDRGSSNNVPPHAVSFTQGLKDLAPQGVTVTSSGNAGDAAGKDIVIIPVTMAHEDEGEAYSNGGDRDDMTLSGNHPAHWSPKPAAFINQVYAVNPNIIVLLAVGSAVIDSDGWMGHARAIVQPFYPGQEGGTAVAKLLYGALNFSGKLPFTVATSEDQYPAFGNAGTSLTVNYLHGYRRFEANSQAPKWWFGFGMSYTTYAYSELKVLCTSVSTSGRLNAQVTVTNTGMMAGDEIVQAYVSFPDNGKLHPPKELKAFTRVHLEPGASAVVPITIPARDLRYYGTNDWAFDLGTYKLRVGPSADPASLQSADFTLN